MLHSDLDVASLQAVVVKLDESSEAALSGGAIAIPSLLNQANKAKQAESSTISPTSALITEVTFPTLDSF